MKTKLFLTSVVASLLAFAVFSASSASAQQVSAPNFPSCDNPQGNLRVSYTSGTHGIPGNSGVFIGSDSVYDVSSQALIQCFCPEQGSGIQTNWWKIPALSQDEIDSFVKQGWIYVPTGSVWGLDDAAYLAKNLTISCGVPAPTPTPTAPVPTPTNKPGNGGSTPPPVCPDPAPIAPKLLNIARNGTTATLVWTPVPSVTHYAISYGTESGKYQYGVTNTGNVTAYTVGSLDANQKYFFVVRGVNNCAAGPASNETIPQGQVLGASTMATTGNSGLIAALIGGGLLFAAVAWYTRRAK